MYLNYYNLNLKPFEINPDPKFLWLGGNYKEALDALRYGILEDKGFLSLTGDTGTGKTTIVNALERRLEDNVIFAKISDPSLEEFDFLTMIAVALEMNKKFSTKGTFLIHLKHFLNDAYAKNKEVVLVIEEAQRLNVERLEQIRLLSNIGRSDKNLLTIIFVGQNEFIKKLNSNKALMQRVTIIHKIKPLQDIEAGEYIMHRLKEAGSDKKIFSASAIREICSFSEGNPRLINNICDLALLTGCEKKVQIIKPKIIRECAEILRFSHQSSKDEVEKEKTIVNRIYENIANSVRAITIERKIPYLASAALIILVFIIGLYSYFSDYSDSSIHLDTYPDKSLRRFSESKSNTLLQNSDEIVIFQGDSASSEIKLLDFNAVKVEKGSQFNQIISENDKIQADLMELKSTKERVAELEIAAKKREQLLTQSEIMLIEFKKELEQEKKSNDLLKAELSTKGASVAELKEKLDSSESNAVKFRDDIKKRTGEITTLQNQMQDLEVQKKSSETQLAQLQSEYAKIQTDLTELKSTQERVVELENTVVKREQLLSQSEQKLAELTNKLEQEKNSYGLLQAELSSKVSSIVSLEEKLEVSASNTLIAEDEINRKTREIAKLRDQLKVLDAQKTSAESQLAQLQSKYEKIQADFIELKRKQERVIELENAAVKREQLLLQSEQKLADLTNDLKKERKSNELLQAELSSKVASIAGLQEELETSNSNSLKFESELEKNKQEIKELQSQLMKLEIQKASLEPSTMIVETQQKQPTESSAVETETESPNPTDIIDWIIKKKSKKEN